MHIEKTYTDFLIDCLVPNIFVGLQYIFDIAYKKARVNNKPDSDSIFINFRASVKEISSWTAVKLDEEIARIKRDSDIGNCLDNIVKSIIKIKIALLIGSSDKANLANELYESFRVSKFIHVCYIERGKYACNNAPMFYHCETALEYVRNVSTIKLELVACINRAIRKSLPIAPMSDLLMTSMKTLFDVPIEVKLIKTASRDKPHKPDRESIKSRTHQSVMPDVVIKLPTPVMQMPNPELANDVVMVPNFHLANSPIYPFNSENFDAMRLDCPTDASFVEQYHA